MVYIITTSKLHTSSVLSFGPSVTVGHLSPFISLTDVLADNEVAQQKTRKSKRKSKKQPKLDGDISVAISQLRSHLLGEEMKEAVVRPMKETVSAGKALLNMGQRFSSWVSSLVKS